MGLEGLDPVVGGEGISYQKCPGEALGSASVRGVEPTASCDPRGDCPSEGGCVLY